MLKIDLTKETKHYVGYFKSKKAGLFAGGVLFGTAGVKLLSVKMQRNFIQIVQPLY